MVMDGHRIVEVNGVDLCVGTIGDAADPAIMLISGMGGSTDWREEGHRCVNQWPAGTGMCHSRVAWRRTMPTCARTTNGAWSGSG